MANSFKSTVNGKVNPITGDSHTNPLDPINSPTGSWILHLPPTLHKHFVTMSFYDGMHSNGLYGKQIKPTSGNIKIEVSDDGINYGPIAHGDIKDLTTNFQQPNFMGYAHSIRVTVKTLRPQAPDGAHGHESTFVVVNTHSYN